MQQSNVDTFRPFDDDLEDENALSIDKDLALDIFKPFDDEEDSKVDLFAPTDSDTFKPLKIPPSLLDLIHK